MVTRPTPVDAVDETIKYEQRYPDGHAERLDPTPVASAVKFGRPPTLVEMIQRLIRTEGSRLARSQGQETFEEADDFDVGSDFDPQSPYEINEELEPWREGDQVKAATEAANTRFKPENPVPRPAPPPPPGPSNGPTPPPSGGAN